MPVKLTEEDYKGIAEKSAVTETQAIIELLKRSGYTFSNDNELKEFLKTRVTTKKQENKVIIFVDDKPVTGYSIIKQVS